MQTKSRIPHRAVLGVAARRSALRMPWLSSAALALVLAQGCAGDAQSGDELQDTHSSLHALIGPEGGELLGQDGTMFEGVKLTIPEGALLDPTEIAIRPMKQDEEDPLPKDAVACGPMFELAPFGLELAKPATLQLPVSQTAVNQNDRFDDEVLVWWLGHEGWGQRAQLDSEPGTVSVQVQALSAGGAGVNPPNPEDIVHVELHPDPNILPCLAQYPDDEKRQPFVAVDIVRGELNDGLFLRGKYIKPELAFDMFSVERSLLDANAVRDAGFHGFGLAWYQSDLEADEHGTMRASIRTILLDQIFGFDPDATLAPTNTFHLGFWFNDPNAAVACGFNADKPTPFNGDHEAGPVAMITLPDADTQLGPLCTHPDTSVSPVRCDP